jgi:hypothetical protein
LRRFTDEIQMEREETIALYQRIHGKHFSSAWATPDIVERVSNHVCDLTRQVIDAPQYLPLAEALDRCLREIIALEKTIVSFPEIDWNSALLSMHEAVDLRRFLRAKEHFLANENRVFKELQTTLANVMGGIIQSLPSLAPDDESVFRVPLFQTMRDPADVVSKITGTLMTDEVLQCGLFTELQNRLYENVCAASGIAPYAETKRQLITADDSELPPEEILRTYLSGTPFLDLFLTPVPYSIPQETRFSGHWVIAPPGKGKTNLLHAMFLDDCAREASIILMDSKGDLINPVRNLKDIEHRLVIVEPDPDFPLALNPLDIPRASITKTIGLLEYVFSGLLEAKLTPLQKTLFRNLLPALVECVPNPTLATFRDIVANGLDRYRQYFDKLEPTIKRFLDTQFDSKTYLDTRNQLVWRLDFLMTNPLLNTMFNSPKTKFDISKEMDAGKIIIINNSKDLLEEEGAEFFGRFFIAMVLAAAQHRSGRPRADKLPCFFYIDECHNVIKRDERITTILDECRSQNIALILAHQRLEQIKDDDVLSALRNCAVRMANSDDDAKQLAPSLRTTPDFLQSLDVGQFALWTRDLKNRPALPLEIPYVDLSRLPALTANDQARLLDRMRNQYCRRELDSSSDIAPVSAPPSEMPESPQASPDTPEAGSTW